jgi:hypothetical protein
MSEQSARGIPFQRVVAPPNDPAELDALTARHREQQKTALGRIGCLMVVAAPFSLLAQYVAELASAHQAVFLKELLDRLAPDALRALDEALKLRLGRGAA